MLAHIIAEKTKSTIVNVFTGEVIGTPTRIKPPLYSRVRNTRTGEIGFIDGYCDDPYAIFNPETVAYVICRYADGSSNYSDHWHLDEIEVLS